MISFVIATRDRPALLARCLASVARHTREPHEVVVVDDGSCAPLQLPEADGASGRAVRVVRSERPLGPAGARKLGVGAARGDVLFFLDDDAALRHDAGSEGLDLLADKPAVGCVAFPIWDVGHGCLLYGGWPGPRKCFAAGAAMFRRSAMDEVGGFDAAMRWSEEFELSVRLHDRGWLVWGTGGEPVLHGDGEDQAPRHSSAKLRRVLEARLAALVLHFPWRVVAVMGARVVASLTLQSVRHRRPLAVPAGLVNTVRALPGLVRRRRVVGRATVLRFTVPDPDEDEHSVPLVGKLVARLGPGGSRAG